MPTHSDEYDKHYEQTKKRSAVLAIQGLRPKPELQSLLLEIKGRISDRMYYDPMYGGSFKPAKLLRTERWTEELKDKFRNLETKCRNEGRPAPESQPELERAKAELAVVREELKHVEKLLATIKEEEQWADDALVLKHGPQGIGKMRDGVLVIIDGQRV